MTVPAGPRTTITLRSDIGIPVLGIGAFRAEAGGQAAAALRAGYRHLGNARS